MAFDVEILDASVAITRVYVPGWGMDGRIFSVLPEDRNVILIHRYDPTTFVDDFRLLLEAHSLAKVELWGLSLGGYLALDVLHALPERIESAVLIGLRDGYPKTELRMVRAALRSQGILAYMPQFYRACFSDDQQYTVFERDVMPDLLQRLRMDDLLLGLDYLAGAKVSLSGVEHLLSCRNGCEDAIATTYSFPSRVFSGAGHVDVALFSEGSLDLGH